MGERRGKYRDIGYIDREVARRVDGDATDEQIAELEALEPDRLTTVYYLHTVDHELLYVGISGHTMRRFGEHLHDKPWWRHVAYSSMEHFDTRAEAMAREAYAIQKLKPRHNQTTPGSTGVNEYGIRLCAQGCGAAAPPFGQGATCQRCRTARWREKQSAS